MNVRLNMVVDQLKRAEDVTSFIETFLKRYPIWYFTGKTPYTKFENSWYLTFEFELAEEEALKLQLQACMGISRPWTLHQLHEEGANLIFNRQDSARFSYPFLSRIRWAECDI